ncbi:MAG: NAD(P)-dependent oxidoreductase [Thermodesulfovibrionia bacterium]|nr:NAD(P)-dependent oxidoreductase [Thermodesulfovibrionia bacterium]
MKGRAVVFGGSGFLGSHVADELAKRDYEVVIYDLRNYARLKNNQSMVIGDITDEAKVRDTVRDADIIYNFSAIADIEEAAVNPVETVKVNILGNTIILNAAREFNVKRFVFASSLYVYGRSGSFYRASKYASELLIESFHEAYDLNYTILRYGSLYGKYVDERNWIYKILKDALTEKKIVRYGDGEEIREYIHVEDAARYSVDILSDEYANECVVLTGHHPIKIKELLKMIKEIMNNEIEIEYLPSPKNFHYEITPYSFTPKMARKLTSNYYIDLGQGILDCLNYIHKKMEKA